MGLEKAQDLADHTAPQQKAKQIAFFCQIFSECLLHVPTATKFYKESYFIINAVFRRIMSRLVYLIIMMEWKGSGGGRETHRLPCL